MRVQNKQVFSKLVKNFVDSPKASIVWYSGLSMQSPDYSTDRDVVKAILLSGKSKLQPQLQFIIVL